MEKKRESQRNNITGKRKAKSEIRISSSRQREIETNYMFAILLAALNSNSFKSNSQSLIKKCLNKLRLFLISQSKQTQTLPIPILALLPVLLKSRCAGTARRCAQVVGAASLSCLETNVQIALDDEIIEGLVCLLRNPNRRVLMAACNAVMDLSTTSLGTQRLLEFSALDTILLELNQVHKSSTLVPLCTGENRNVVSHRIGFKKDEFPVLLLDVAMVLINNCNTEHLAKIPRKLSECFLVFLKELWIKARNRILSGNIIKSAQEKPFCSSNITVNNLAESIFRLSISADQLTAISSERVERSIFHLNDASFENFIRNYWEVSPFLVRSLSNSSIEGDDIFSPFLQYLGANESFGSFLSFILKHLISCVPIASDESDILNFLKEVRNKLGCPLIYEQDIRVLRTDKLLKRELHYFPSSSNSCLVQAPYLIYADDISKCEEAYKKGYTIALRGMEFRFEYLATIANGLASLFGQPSIGANMYLTPPNSQGLACHYDDHCVFVCQLLGTKQWKIFEQPSFQLPRLYHPCDIINDVGAESSMADCRQFSLREGDILYIPRGFLHEAWTIDDGSTGSTGFSLHLTLGIEVEPPFEWEGFAHVALCCWNQAQNVHHHAAFESLSGILNLMSVNLLHLVIGLIGDSDPTFHKACLVGALACPSDSSNWLYLNQRTIFVELINKISVDSRFLELLSSVEIGIRERIDLVQQMRWLQFLDGKGETVDGHDWNIPFTGVEIMFPLYVEHKELAETAFMQVKSKFCSEVSFEDVIEKYKIMLGKYKETRRQYTKGMLSLHCN